jgi:hypothetical protein
MFTENITNSSSTAVPFNLPSQDGMQHRDSSVPVDGFQQPETAEDFFALVLTAQKILYEAYHRMRL